MHYGAERVDDAVAVEPVEGGRSLARRLQLRYLQLGGRRIDVGSRFRAGYVQRCPREHPLDEAWPQRAPTMDGVVPSPARHDQRGHAGGMWRVHRRAVVIDPVPGLAVDNVAAHTIRGLRGVEESALLQGNLARRAEDTVLGLRVGGRAREVERVPARGRDVGLLDAVVGVPGLPSARAHGADTDDAFALGRHAQARVVHGPGLLAARRVIRAGRVLGGVAEVGRLVAESRDQRDPVTAREAQRALGRLDDRLLLGLLRERVRRVGRAVVEPRVGVEAHVHDIDAVIARKCERVDRRLEEEEARVLAGSEIDEPDARGDAPDSDLVERRPDGAGDMGSMTTLVDVRRVLAGLVRILLARTVDDGVVNGEVAAELAV